ncbi:MAG: SRPBCC domain-containing protein [Deltaproteobacteria bacterium]|jgi:hypothetical protein
MARRTFRADTEIGAPAADVWAALLELDRYGEWNPFTVSMRSSLAVGSPIDMRVRMSRWRLTLSQREIVREVRPPGADRAGRLVWGATMPGIVAERVQTVTPLGPRRAHYLTEDTIEGPLAGLSFALFGSSLEDGFGGVARELKRHVESRGASVARP